MYQRSVTYSTDTSCDAKSFNPKIVGRSELYPALKEITRRPDAVPDPAQDSLFFLDKEALGMGYAKETMEPRRYYDPGLREINLDPFLVTLCIGIKKNGIWT
jgi:hypothetical protein